MPLASTTLTMCAAFMSAVLRFVMVPVAILLIWVLGVAGSTAVQALQFDEKTITEYARTQHGERAASYVGSWLNMLNQAQPLSERDQLSEVNEFWNSHVRGDEDINIWGKEDYWATPIETLAKGAGDCEDFVIAKYFSLVRSGVEPDKLRFIYVRARIGGPSSSTTIAHMVLGYYPTSGAEPLILDNLSSSITTASNRPDLKPVFSFNASGVYVPGEQPRPAERIGHWRDLLSRMQKEGFQP